MKLRIISNDNGNRTITRHEEKGFTFIELLIVLAVVTMIGSTALYFSFDDMRGHSFHEDRDTLISLLQHARSQALLNICRGTSCTDGKPYGVAIRPIDHPHSYVLFQTEKLHPTYNMRTKEDNKNDIVVATNSTGNSTEVVFIPISGDTTNPNEISILLSNNEGRQSTVTISPIGQIDWDK